MPWNFADTERTFAEVHFGGSESHEADGFVVKAILRTGEWPVIPTRGGKVNKPLRIVRDGVSNPDEGIISLSELVENFGKAIDNVQIPLSDNENDHKNITRVNTGFVRGLWIEDSDNGSKLVAKMEFTEPEIREKVLRGTYVDVSCGIPWSVSSRGQRYGSVLEHVAITNRPFIDGLGPFAALSDDDKGEVEVVAFGSGEVEIPEPVVEPVADVPAPELWNDEQILAAANAHLSDELRLSGDYRVVAIADGLAVIDNPLLANTWTAPVEVTGEAGAQALTIANFSDWTVKEEEPDEPAPRGAEMSALEQARALRQLLLSGKSNTQTKERNMPLTRDELAALEMSEDARSEIQRILDENSALRASSREVAVDRRVDELKDLGLSERPGFLKLYRDVMLSDDGGPAVVLSENGGSDVSLSALEILDRTVEALKGSDSKVHLSDQALVSGSDEKPPADAGGETKSVEERLAEAKAELYPNRK